MSPQTPPQGPTMEEILFQLKIVVEYLGLAQRLGQIPGYLHDMQGYALMLLAAHGPGDGEIVEIGSFMGKSTCWLAMGAKSVGREKVTAIDHFEGSPEHQAGARCEVETIVEEGTTFNRFLEHIKAMAVDDYVQPIVASSEEAATNWDKPIRLLFIDGDHSYEQSKKDFELWSPFVVPGGVVAFHDINDWPGVTQFYNELMASGRGYTEQFAVMGLNVIRRE